MSERDGIGSIAGGIIGLIVVVIAAFSVWLYVRDSAVRTQPQVELSAQLAEFVFADARRNGIVVLPLESREEVLSSTAFGVSEDINAMLIENSGATVVGLESAQAVVSGDPGPDGLRAMLNVEYALSGEVYGDGGGAPQVSLRLVSTSSGKAVWQRTLALPADLEAGVAMPVARQIGVEYTARSAPPALPAELGKTFDTARQLLSHYVLEDVIRAGELLDQVLGEYPEYAPALVLRAAQIEAHKYMVGGPTSWNDRKWSLVERALAADPDNLTASRMLANRARWEERWLDAWRQFESLMAEYGQDIDTRHYYIDFLMTTGYIREAWALANLNVQQNPMSGRSHMQALQIAVLMNDPDRMYVHARIMNDLDAEYALQVLGFYEVMFGDRAKGARLIAESNRKLGVASAWVEPFYRLVGSDEAAAVELLMATDDDTQGYEENFLLHLSAAGKPELAWQALERAHDDGTLFLHHLWLPGFEQQRRQPEFMAFAESVDLPALWAVKGPPDHCARTTGETSPGWVCN